MLLTRDFDQDKIISVEVMNEFVVLAGMYPCAG